MTLMPILTLICFLIGIGGYPSHMKLAIINKEIGDAGNCTNFSVMNDIDENLCKLSQVSCKFLSELDDIEFIKVYYSDFRDAFRDAKSGKILAILKFHSNFSQSFGIRMYQSSDDISDETIDSSQIEIFIDQTNHINSNYFKKKVYDAYKSFTTYLAEECGVSKKQGQSSINFLDPIYGQFNSDFKKGMTPAAVITFLFYFAAVLNAFIIIDDRNSGCWNRMLMCGVGIIEVVVSHIAVQTCVLIVILFNFVIILSFYFSEMNLWQISIFAVVLFMSQLNGLLVGMCIACISGSAMKTQFALSGMLIADTFLSGEYQSCT